MLLLASVLQCHQGQFPDLETVDQYVGIFITGSPVSANNTEQYWIQKQKQWLITFAGVQRRCKLVASCYGCQVIRFELVCSYMAADVFRQPCKDSFLHVTHKLLSKTKSGLQQLRPT